MRISRTGEDKDMVKLYDKGVYLLNGTEIVEDVNEVRTKTGREVSQAEAAKETMAYRILADHNTSGNMEPMTLRLSGSFRQQGHQGLSGSRFRMC